MEKSYPVKPILSNAHSFLCVPCNKRVRCNHQGLKDVKDHCKRELHKAVVSEVNRNKPIAQFFPAAITSKDVIKTEVMVTNFLIPHNLPIATTAHLGHLFTTIFPESKIVKSYACSATKTETVTNKAMGPHCHEYIVELCKQHPFS